MTGAPAPDPTILGALAEWVGGITGVTALIGVVLRVGEERRGQKELEKRMAKAERRLDSLEEIKSDVASVKADVNAIKSTAESTNRQVTQIFDHLLDGHRDRFRDARRDA